MRRFVLGATLLALGALSVSIASAQNMTVTSAEVSDGATIQDAQVANVFGCKGGNISPSLSWSGAPADTKSFAITVYDPDAPTGSGFWHWVVFNIPSSTTSIPKDAGNEKKKLMPKVSSRAAPISAPTDMAAHARRKATGRITTFSRCTRSTKINCSSPRPQRLSCRRWFRIALSRQGESEFDGNLRPLIRRPLSVSTRILRHTA
jgi:phosphatidylethanolamine-binding protein (PEBP) family uncharacterized protein